MKLSLAELNKPVTHWNLAHEDVQVLESFIKQFPHMVGALHRYKSTYLNEKKVYYAYLVRPPTEEQLNPYTGFMVLCTNMLNKDLYNLVSKPQGRPFLAYAEIEKEQQLIKRTITL